MASITLQTGTRVALRRPCDGDRDAFIASIERSRQAHLPWVEHPPVDDEGSLFTRYLERCNRDDFDGLLVCRIDDGSLIGVFNLSQIFYGPFRSAYLSYFAFEGFEGRGYMSEGLGLVLDYAFQTLGLHRLEANVQPENTRSIALIRRAGFRREGFSPRYLRIGGQWRDHERWAILNDEGRNAQDHAQPVSARPSEPPARD